MPPLRILIVTDRSHVAAELEAKLAGVPGSLVVGTASSGGDAIAMASSTAPALVLVELALGGDTDAVEAADAIRRERPVGMVFMGPEEDEAGVYREEFARPGYLVPPFSERELRTTIELALCRQHETRAVHELEGFFDVSIDMFCFLDDSGYFRRLNQAWERTLGFTREELMSRRFIEFVHPDDRERTLAQNAAVRAGGQARGFENRYRCRDGSYRWLHWNATRQPAEGVVYSAARDVTARKEAEAERARLVERLERSLAEVRTLRGILPICMYCRRIRDDGDYWHTVESYISSHTDSRFSHGICPTCMTTEVEPQFLEEEEEEEPQAPAGS